MATLIRKTLLGGLKDMLDAHIEAYAGDISELMITLQDDILVKRGENAGEYIFKGVGRHTVGEDYEFIYLLYDINNELIFRNMIIYIQKSEKLGARLDVYLLDDKNELVMDCTITPKEQFMGMEVKEKRLKFKWSSRNRDNIFKVRNEILENETKEDTQKKLEDEIYEGLKKLTILDPSESAYITEAQLDETMQKLKELRRFENIEICLIGRYIWISGDTYPIKEELKALGFQYRYKRWNWTAGDIVDSYRKNSERRLKNRYGCIEIN